MTDVEYRRVQDITDEFGYASMTFCEWCGRAGQLHDERKHWQT